MMVCFVFDSILTTLRAEGMFSKSAIISNLSCHANLSGNWYACRVLKYSWLGLLLQCSTVRWWLGSSHVSSITHINDDMQKMCFCEWQNSYKDSCEHKKFICVRCRPFQSSVVLNEQIWCTNKTSEPTTMMRKCPLICWQWLPGPQMGQFC